MDYEANCQKENIESSKENKEKSNRNVLDYFLIEINNSNQANKPIHYHLVEENHLLLLLKKFLPKNVENKDDKKIIEPTSSSQVLFIHSFPAQKESFDQNYAFLQNIISNFNDEWEIKAEPKQRKVTKFNHETVRSHLKSISNGVSINTYNSLRSFNSFKQFLIN